MAGLQRTDGDTPRLPPPSPNQVYVKVSALNGGFVTLPERNFVTDADPEKGTTVPSLCFLIEHVTPGAAKPERIVFDLGIKRDLTKYIPATRKHITGRQPVYSTPDARSSLLTGGLDPKKDIDYVILSHVHWDHIGEPSDYPNSKFIVGSGTRYILENGAPNYPPDRIIEKGVLPEGRTIELPPTPGSDRVYMAAAEKTQHQWQSISALPNVVDYFGDGSLWIVDSPGHIHGHVNALLRVRPDKWLYLGGDCCHDRRILTGERGIAEYDDGHGKIKSAHSELSKAKQTIQNIQNLIAVNGDIVEWVVAHDWKWATENQHRFLPGSMY
ncbi:beta-lactamase-like protein [Xylogone sp. PMI_703]|nr:beta-lactamase-like protein [Xylogone sp. PMI_703]